MMVSYGMTNREIAKMKLFHQRNKTASVDVSLRIAAELRDVSN